MLSVWMASIKILRLTMMRMKIKAELLTEDDDQPLGFWTYELGL